MRLVNVGIPVLFLVGCASGGGASRKSGPEAVAPAPAQANVEGAEAVGSGGSEEKEPQIIHTGNARSLGWDAAQDRYAKKGNKCGGSDSPEQAIGKPDQKNEMQVGRDKIITFGFRYKEGTLIIRCRNDHVEATRTLAK